MSSDILEVGGWCGGFGVRVEVRWSFGAVFWCSVLGVQFGNINSENAKTQLYTKLLGNLRIVRFIFWGL